LFQRRGPFIAELELEHTILDKYPSGIFYCIAVSMLLFIALLCVYELIALLGVEKRDEKVMQTLLVNYFKYFGDKNCCYTDIKQYLQHIPQQDCTAFISALQTSLPSPADDDTVSTTQ
jgi:hypothetical protein